MKVPSHGFGASPCDSWNKVIVDWSHLVFSTRQHWLNRETYRTESQGRGPFVIKNGQTYESVWVDVFVDRFVISNKDDFRSFKGLVIRQLTNLSSILNWSLNVKDLRESFSWVEAFFRSIKWDVKDCHVVSILMSNIIQGSWVQTCGSSFPQGPWSLSELSLHFSPS